MRRIGAMIRRRRPPRHGTPGWRLALACLALVSFLSGQFVSMANGMAAPTADAAAMPCPMMDADHHHHPGHDHAAAKVPSGKAVKDGCACCWAVVAPVSLVVVGHGRGAPESMVVDGRDSASIVPPSRPPRVF